MAIDFDRSFASHSKAKFWSDRNIKKPREVSNWTSPEVAQERDKYKTQKALENGYTVIRILQEDIFKNVIGWEDQLVNFLS